jgi:hypothetical protein
MIGRHAAKPPIPAAVVSRRSGTGHPLAYVYYEDEPGRRAAANLLMKDEARRIAANIAKPPDLTQRSRS